MKPNQYLHGYDLHEQERLLKQAEFLRPYLYPGIELKEHRNLLEVGCGVGAQTKILCSLFPKLKVTGVDVNERQLNLARKHLKKELGEGRVQLMQSDAQNLNIQGSKYDSAFLCWLLEHVPEPLTVLGQIRRHLRPGARIYCTEVFNQTFFLEPYSPNLLKYWFEFNDFQASIGGHPFVGASLGNLLKTAGFKNVQTELRPFHFDSRQALKRAAFIEYFFNIFLSAEKSLLAVGRVTKGEVRKMRAEVELVKKSKEAVFFYACMRATATR